MHQHCRKRLQQRSLGAPASPVGVAALAGDPMARVREAGKAAAAASRARRMMPATTRSESRPAVGAARQAATARARAAAPVFRQTHMFYEGDSSEMHLKNQIDFGPQTQSAFPNQRLCQEFAWPVDKM